MIVNGWCRPPCSMVAIVFAILFVRAVAHPSSFECNDARFEPGYQAMHILAQPNQKDPALSFTADTYEYTHGSEVHFTVKANGDKYVKSPYGVYLAVRAQARLGWKGDFGTFSKMTPGLNLTTKTWGNQPCTNTLFSDTPFPGKNTFTWTAGDETYDEVIISLMWGNGVGHDDPLYDDFSNVSQPYLYLRTVSLKGPPIPNHPPFLQQPTTNKCVAPAGNRYNLPHSPVFVQTLRTFPAKSITFPAGRCIACREDQHVTCLSARIDCPAEPGMLATETIYKTRNCSDSGLTQKLPTSYAHCPGADYHSPEKLDLERFVHKLQRDHPTYFKDEATARSAISEYRRVLYIIQKFPDAPVVPSKLVDLVWHEHILDTQEYKRDSQQLFGRYIHHAPAFGDDNDEAVKAEKQSMLEDQAEMFKQYVQLFEDEPRQDVWPTAQRQLSAGARAPDCCKASCVKPDCASCVGCNAVDCGKMEENADLLRTAMDGQAKMNVLPEHFAGYVPLPSSLAQRLEAQDQSYLCSANPLPGMNLSWTISGDSIYMKQTLEKVEAWYAVGFTDVEPYDMSYADYIVTMFNKNYTGIRDMYKYDEGNNYPCWDVLTQCSLNGTAGTLDLTDRTTTRENGVSTSTWTRKLVTGDYKDSPITETSKKVLFGQGIEDYFTYHDYNAITCDINFFTGDVKCGGSSARVVV